MIILLFLIFAQETPALLIYAPIIAVVISMLTLIYTIWKGRKTDKAEVKADESLNISENINNTFHAQQTLIKQLQDEVVSYKREVVELRNELKVLRIENYALQRKLETHGDS